ncbi:hypothetical protein LZ30DRAFT_703335 [Colletotrichum cereale]|nr:hypothetical protein LZ30DRAFT_703335 [Colletotrichum cereale]
MKPGGTKGKAHVRFQRLGLSNSGTKVSPLPPPLRQHVKPVDPNAPWNSSRQGQGMTRGDRRQIQARCVPAVCFARLCRQVGFETSQVALCSPSSRSPPSPSPGCIRRGKGSCLRALLRFIRRRALARTPLPNTRLDPFFSFSSLPYSSY